MSMDQSFTLSNSPSPVKKLTANAQQAFDLAGELYSLTQQWHLFNSTGRNIVNSITQSKVEVWDNPAHFKEIEVSLESHCDQLSSIVSEMVIQERLVKQMSRIGDQYTALGKLEELQQPKIDAQLPRLLFLTWPASVFGQTVLAIRKAYAEELKVKKCIAENIAHCQDRESINFHKIAWVHQVCITPSIKMQLESLLLETGQR